MNQIASGSSPTWRNLIELEAFQSLFDSSDSPVHEQIKLLIRRTQDIGIVDPIETMRDRATLYGILFVRRAVETAAEEAAKSTQASSERRASRLGSMLLPRRSVG